MSSHPWAMAPDPQPGATLSGAIVIERFQSERLRDNPLGDPSVRDIPVYLPPSYAEAPHQRYPAIYWLHPFTSTARSALNYNPWAPSLPETADALIKSGEAPAFILVMVDGFTKYGGSQFINSSATGQYEDYIVEELAPHVDRTYRTQANRDHRGIVGHSSGGYGALVLGMRHPEVFGGVASHSGDLYFELCYRQDFPKFLNTVARYDGVEALLRAFLDAPKKSGDLLAAINVAAMAMAYSPNPASPYGFDLPFDLHSGELRLDVWQRWLEHDPVALAPRYAEALQSLKVLYFECGTRDEFQLHFGARILARRLRELGIAHEHQEFDDSHSGIGYRFREGLVRLARGLTPV